MTLPQKMPLKERNGGIGKNSKKGPAILSDPTDFDPLRSVAMPTPDGTLLNPFIVDDYDLSQVPLSIEQESHMFHESVSESFQPITKMDIKTFQSIPPSTNVREVDEENYDSNGSEVPSSTLCERLIASLLIDSEGSPPLTNGDSLSPNLLLPVTLTNPTKHGDECIEKSLTEVLYDFGLLAESDLPTDDIHTELNQTKSHLLNIQEKNIAMQKDLANTASKEIASQGAARETKREEDLTEISFLKAIIAEKKRRKKGAGTLKNILRVKYAGYSEAKLPEKKLKPRNTLKKNVKQEPQVVDRAMAIISAKSSTGSSTQGPTGHEKE